MVRRIVVSAVGLVLLVGTDLADGSPGRCQSQKSRTIAKSDLARVYQKAGKTFGCLYSVNRRVQIGTNGSNLVATDGQRNVRLAGRFVAFEDFVTGKDTLTFTVVVFDLRARHAVVDVGTGAIPNRGFGDFQAGMGPTTSLRLRPTGQVAWIAQDLSFDAPRYEVHAHGRKDHLLAAGTDVDPTSLGLIGNRLSWKQAGTRQHANLGPPPD